MKEFITFTKTFEEHLVCEERKLFCCSCSDLLEWQDTERKKTCQLYQIFLLDDTRALWLHFVNHM